MRALTFGGSLLRHTGRGNRGQRRVENNGFVAVITRLAAVPPVRALGPDIFNEQAGRIHTDGREPERIDR